MVGGSQVVGVLAELPVGDVMAEPLQLVALVGDEGRDERRAENLGDVLVLFERVDAR